eukprot:TRINITY_DN23653_c0_g1_i2.p1 TRINITY_DN23653_c0_g1~~TRINITY_DN23653_c0_g1_i2.p1  ORF type:complete len:192 (+),score=40.02 TRINITY_DN23653_c0_g1_i2:52-627(+)
MIYFSSFFFQAEDGIRDAQESRGLGDVYKRQDERCSHYMCQWLLVMAICMLGLLLGCCNPCFCCLVTFTIVWAMVGAAHLASLHASCSTAVLDFAWYAILGSLFTTAAVLSFMTYITYLHRHEIIRGCEEFKKELAKGSSEAYGSVTSYASSVSETYSGIETAAGIPTGLPPVNTTMVPSYNNSNVREDPF